MNYQKLCIDSIEICKEVGKYILKENKTFDKAKIETKGRHDFVSYVDKQSEKKLVSAFKSMLPDSSFVVEESTITEKEGKLNWIIDPLDGTTNFIHGVPLYSISVALQENGNTVLGIVYELNLDECFYAWEGSKAYLNGDEIRVSDTKKVEDSLIATGFPYYDYSRLEEYNEIFIYLLKNSRGVRRLGSAAVDLAYVACGRFDVFYEYGLRPWDVAAGAFIVQQAGGVNFDFNGGYNYIYGSEIVSSNSFLSDEFLNICKKHFK